MPAHDPDPRHPSDETLMERYRAGDARAHRELFERLAPMLLAICERRLRDRAEAEDVVQRTFLSLHRARHDFRDGARVRPFVATIALNLVRDALRRRAHRRPSAVDPDGCPARGGDPRAVERDQMRRLVREALASLPEDQRVAVELHWLEERPFAEVAVQVGASVTAVKVRAHRGYVRMRAWLEARGVSDGAIERAPA